VEYGARGRGEEDEEEEEDEANKDQKPTSKADSFLTTSLADIQIPLLLYI
jgi:hypothetical protein